MPRRKNRGSNLIKQRLEEMVIDTINQDHVDGSVFQGARSSQANPKAPPTITTALLLSDTVVSPAAEDPSSVRAVSSIPEPRSG